MEGFIKHFQNTSPSQNVIETFTSGCCYWFAYILCARFQHAEMMYDPIWNHFMARLDGELFDITGKVTEQYPDAIPWDDFDDELEKDRIVQECIDFSK